ncbi:hypothetical protein O0235_02295 [Tepidiforma flava]|uniref:Major facilitator superfamily (MFS) profile domain-containing protein n=1 Tax=Tepidiforma flava TaxID=3004094 RepID=A0ABY7M7E2_9CHLR|nr:hypothetical protein [Tepidiforma flava]WBL36419.1 hypothetical protein O0235_02295 [Tepidiforma flava]
MASFAVVFNNLIITPILPEISEDFGVRVAVAGLLVTAYAVTGAWRRCFRGRSSTGSGGSRSSWRGWRR